MFHIFGKKYFLIDYLRNFVDIHNHLLPGIDDGAKNVRDSMDLIRGFAEFGVTRFICTPHIMHNLYPNTPATIQKSLSEVGNALLQNNLRHISIEAAAEHMIDDNFETLLEAGQIMAMRSEYLLVEMSFLQPPLNFDPSIVQIAANRFFPILAHPERYGFLNRRALKIGQFKDQGILMQMNMLSLSDYYDRQVHKTALKLLDEGLIDFLASDVHHMGQLICLKEITLPKKVIKQLIPVIQRTIEVFY